MAQARREPTTVFVPDWLEPVPVKNKVRLGKRSDGGYVVTKNTVLAANALAGLGVATDWTFEEDFFAWKHGNFPVHCYDNRVTPLRFLEISAGGLCGYLLPSRKAKRPRKSVFPNFVRFFVLNRTVSLHKTTVGADGEAIGITEILARFGEKIPIFVKMDIEGAEYSVLREIRENRHLLAGAVIEFHECTANLRRIAEFVGGIGDDLCLTHIQANNMGGVGENNMPTVLTLTFEKASLVERQPQPYEYPVDGLDFPSDPDSPDYRIEFVSHPASEGLGIAAWRRLQWVVPLDICASLLALA